MNLAVRAAVCPPALRAAILRGSVAQRPREGRCLSAPLERKLAQARAVSDVSEAVPAGAQELQRLT
eukprot:6205001-Alexandrium_andersonii.AAC.1